jgi:hypothetical protein
MRSRLALVLVAAIVCGLSAIGRPVRQVAGPPGTPAQLARAVTGACPTSEQCAPAPRAPAGSPALSAASLPSAAAGPALPPERHAARRAEGAAALAPGVRSRVARPPRPADIPER